MARTTSYVAGLVLILSLGGCSSMLGSLNPLSKKPSIDVTAQVGKNNIKEDRTQLVEAKSVSTTNNDNKADTINQDYTNVEPWMVILIALGFGLALPSPTAWYSHSRETRFLKQQIEILQRNIYGYQRTVTRGSDMQKGRLHEAESSKAEARQDMPST